MRNLRSLVALAALVVFQPASFAAPGLILPGDGVIGRNLEVFATVRLAEPAPAAGLDVTITSDDPTRLLLSEGPVKAGSKSITLKVKAQYVETPDFYIQALGDSGTATYTVTAPGLPSANGSVTLGRSALIIAGPFGGVVFRTTTGAPAKLTITSAVLDSAGNPGQQQAIAGGLNIKAELLSSDAKVGAATPVAVTLAGGATSAVAEFTPAGVGKTSLTVKLPPGFSTPAQFASVAATVDLPGIGLMGEINLGKDLQVQGVVLLGEPAPAKGLDVKLTSEDPKRMLLSTQIDKTGSSSVTIHVSGGESRVPYYIQSLADSGTIEYTATAPGYRTRTAPVTLTPSGVMVVYSPYGAPDEAEFLRAKQTIDPRPFTTSLAEHKPLHLALWTVYLDPKTMRGADMTAQRLRPGVTAAVELDNSNPAVAKIARSVTVSSASEFAMTEFVPVSPGQTVISAHTPPGFSTPSNATSVTATVKE